MKKGFTLIELLAVIVLLGIISAIAYPKILNVIENSKISAFNSSKKLIIESAKTKYLADVSKANVTEYKVVDLIEDGYINKGAKNPLTGKDYSDSTKVLVTNEDGNIKFYYIDGDTLLSKISKLDNNSGLYKENDEYLFKGENAKNYISFNEKIYKVIKIDKNGYTYIIENECNNSSKRDNVNSNLVTIYNDQYSEDEKKMISDNLEIISANMYKDTLLNNSTFIKNGKDMWINDNLDYKILTSDTNEIIKDDSVDACIKMVLKLRNNIIVQNGDGSEFNPYIINMQNY